tara:strand:+ start:886 stop:1110 length:225 start_codon:yes stop_codon:yes gene_type:complete
MPENIGDSNIMETIKNINFDELIHNSHQLRKVTLSDIIGKTSDNLQNSTHIPSQHKIKKYRIQEEYGEKKFIKP